MKYSSPTFGILFTFHLQYFGLTKWVEHCWNNIIDTEEIDDHCEAIHERFGEIYIEVFFELLLELPLWKTYKEIKIITGWSRWDISMLRNVHSNYWLDYKLTNLENRENSKIVKNVKIVKIVKIRNLENRSVFEQNVDEVYVRACARAHL